MPLAQRTLAAAVAIAGLVSASAQPAAANFADALGGNCVMTEQRECYADSAAHDWGHQVGPRTLAAIRSTLFGSYETTDLNISDDPKPHTAHVDVWYRFDALAGSRVGQWSCQAWSGHLCDHAHVIFDPDMISGWSSDWLKKLACHETGHSVGLTHPGADPDGDPRFSSSQNYRCMVQGTGIPSSVGPHNVRHINGRY